MNEKNQQTDIAMGVPRMYALYPLWFGVQQIWRMVKNRGVPKEQIEEKYQVRRWECGLNELLQR